MDGHMGGMWLWWLIGIAIVVAVVWVVFSAGKGPTTPEDSPEAILKRRYAHGEIGKEDYERMLGDLRK